MRRSVGRTHPPRPAPRGDPQPTVPVRARTAADVGANNTANDESNDDLQIIAHYQRRSARNNVAPRARTPIPPSMNVVSDIQDLNFQLFQATQRMILYQIYQFYLQQQEHVNAMQAYSNGFLLLPGFGIVLPGQALSMQQQIIHAASLQSPQFNLFQPQGQAMLAHLQPMPNVPQAPMVNLPPVDVGIASAADFVRLREEVLQAVQHNQLHFAAAQQLLPPAINNPQPLQFDQTSHLYRATAPSQIGSIPNQAQQPGQPAIRNTLQQFLHNRAGLTVGCRDNQTQAAAFIHRPTPRYVKRESGDN